MTDKEKYKYPSQIFPTKSKEVPMTDKIEKILKDALWKAYCDGRADNVYVPEEVIPRLKLEIEQAGYTLPSTANRD